MDKLYVILIIVLSFIGVGVVWLRTKAKDVVEEYVGGKESFLTPEESQLLDGFDRCLQNEAIDNKVIAVNRCYHPFFGSVVHAEYLGQVFKYDYIYYYDWKRRTFNENIKVPVEANKVIANEHTHIFTYVECNISHLRSTRIQLAALNLQNVAEFKSIVENLPSRTCSLSQIQEEEQELSLATLRLNRAEEYEDTSSMEKEKDRLERSLGLKKAHLHSVKEQLKDKKAYKYVTFFQFYAKVLAYNLYIPSARFKDVTDADVDEAIRLKSSVCNAYIRHLNTIKGNPTIQIFPVTCQWGLYISVVYDSRFGIIVLGKGTEEANEWAINLQRDGVGSKDILNNFQIVFSTVEDIMKLYYEKHKSYIEHIAFTGHSLGGALSQLLSILLVHNVAQKTSQYFSQLKGIHTITFNSAGITPFWRKFSNAALNALEASDIKCKVYHTILRRQFDVVHMTGVAAFQAASDGERETYFKLSRWESFKSWFVKSAETQRDTLMVKDELSKSRKEFKKFQTVVLLTNDLEKPFVDPAMVTKSFIDEIKKAQKLSADLVSSAVQAVVMKILKDLMSRCVLSVHTKAFFTEDDIAISVYAHSHAPEENITFISELNYFETMYIPTLIRDLNLGSAFMSRDEKVYF